jgi:nitrogen fixation/metabolism regulation signal transduction histidine kinase
MAYSRFSVNITIRIILIVTNCFFLVTEYFLRDYYVTIINLAILLLFQTILLIRYVRKMNLQIIDYFDLIKNKESGFRLNNAEDKDSFSVLRKHFNETNQIIQDIRIEKEIQTNYINHLVNYINIGLFSFDESEKIHFINPEAKKILGITNLFKIDDLNIIKSDFANFLRNIQPGQSEVIELSVPAIKQKLSVSCAILNLKDSKIKLISFQNIDKHLYKNEIESWNKLIRILNHEIMNSITPITSLSKTMKKYFFDGQAVKNLKDITPQTISRTVEGLDIIEERGVGLINFVNSYRKLSSLPEPKRTEIKLSKLLNQVKDLFINEIESRKIDLKIELMPDDIILFADKDQITQILINILRNSFDAILENNKGKIRIYATKNKSKITLSITDNGTGITPEIQNDIFIPFYTTKDSGSGIGLSLSKQIMELHDGTISVTSIPEKSTEFKLVFNKK